ncbi:class I SAM-dependent methyltransferase [uncultured Draconibacterium sp.]|uniref:class I SAM-dependent methyltransferase n=1 Tax=uncultured Draconibacterium sp. TaxID=1573823 RepID=UPI0025F6F1FF|nr:class I SAM-dependent methyltransferase [uncultured Draconibacterium sp.]
MKTKNTINFDQVADIYDNYVNVDFDIPFFIKETENYGGEELLELMCGTGRVSIPLLTAGRKMTCVDYSKGMLQSFGKKMANKAYSATLVQMDVTKLHLDKTFGMILLPFHSLSEILTTEKQQAALTGISNHLKPGGTFILTLQNPETRLKLADGKMRVIGNFPVDKDRNMLLSYTNQYNKNEELVSGYQFYEIYNAENTMLEKRILEINFKPVSLEKLKSMVLKTEMEITELYGDYSYGEFEPQKSEFIICKMRKKWQ